MAASTPVPFMVLIITMNISFFFTKIIETIIMSQANGTGTAVKYILHFRNGDKKPYHPAQILATVRVIAVLDCALGFTFDCLPTTTTSTPSTAVMIFALIKIRASPPRHDKMWVERSPSGKLYLVRKKYTPPKPKACEELVEVYENLAEAGHVEVVQVEHLRAKDKPNPHHHHPRCADDKKPIDNSPIRIDIGGLEDGTKHIIVGNGGTPGGISITVGAHKRCKAADQPAQPSPHIIIREPVHVKLEKPAEDPKKKAKQGDVRLEPVRWEKVRVKKVHPAEEVRVNKRSPRPEAERLPRDDHEKYTEIKVPRREPKPHRMPEVEGAAWDEKLQAWIVKRSPRVRFD
ncbi:hypothetical protein ABEF95_013467 [Exophiala dermatitidis]